MKNRKRKRIGLFLNVVFLLVMMLSVPVSAKITKDTEKMLKQNMHDYLSSIFSLEDSMYDQVRERGGFYAIMIDTIRENQDTVGSMVSVGDVKVTETDVAVICTTKVKFENYDVDVVVTCDATGSLLTNFVMNIDYPLFVQMGQAGMNILIGILLVFVIILFLTGVIFLLGFIDKGINKKKTKLLKMPLKDMPKIRAVLEERPISREQEADNIELAIVLAVAIAEEEHPSVDGYMVRPIKKTYRFRKFGKN
ncbi:MAG: OadG family protein [Lachnospiraceae bacterium]|nr:OadG family protein [Lachnospiraceae bacterium]